DDRVAVLRFLVLARRLTGAVVHVTGLAVEHGGSPQGGSPEAARVLGRGHRVDPLDEAARLRVEEREPTWMAALVRPVLRPRDADEEHPLDDGRARVRVGAEGS